MLSVDVRPFGYQSLPSVREVGVNNESSATAPDVNVNSEDQVQSDFVKLNARRELEIHTLQDQLEQSKMENAQLLVQLETVSKERDALQLALFQSYDQHSSRPEQMDDGQGLAPGKVQEEPALCPTQDLQVLEAVVLESDLESNRPVSTRSKSCLGNVFKLLGAPLRLSINKFEELDAFMAEHVKQMERQRRLATDPDEIIELERAFQKLRVDAMVDLLKCTEVELESSAVEVEDNQVASCTSIKESTVDNATFFDMADVVAETTRTGDGEINEDDWIADGFA